MKHPIINNIILMFISIMFIIPFTMSCMSIYTEYQNSSEVSKTSQTIAYIKAYKPIVSINGTASSYRTTLQYEINNQIYETTISTTYPVAYEGQRIVIYYEPGNPYNVSPKITIERFSFADKIKLLLIALILDIVLFIIKTLNDIDKASKYKDEMKLKQQLIKSGAFNINQNQLDNSINSLEQYINQQDKNNFN